MRRAGERLGSIAPGKLADLILVDGDPSTDPGALRHLRLVVKDGVRSIPRPCGASSESSPCPNKLALPHKHPACRDCSRSRLRSSHARTAQVRTAGGPRRIADGCSDRAQSHATRSERRSHPGRHERRHLVTAGRRKRAHGRRRPSPVSACSRRAATRRSRRPSSRPASRRRSSGRAVYRSTMAEAPGSRAPRSRNSFDGSTEPFFDIAIAPDDPDRLYANFRGRRLPSRPMAGSTGRRKRRVRGLLRRSLRDTHSRFDTGEICSRVARRHSMTPGSRRRTSIPRIPWLDNFTFVAGGPDLRSRTGGRMRFERAARPDTLYAGSSRAR